MRAGTPLWMAPEVKAGTSYDLPADVYSLGIVLFELFQCTMPEYDDDTERVILVRHFLSPFSLIVADVYFYF